MNAVLLISYEITNEPLQDRNYRRLPQHVKDAIERLHHDTQAMPRKAIPEILKMLEKYPRVPQLSNYLAIAYAHSGETARAEAVIRETLQRHPDYLFARLNYAEICLHRKEYAKIAEIFDHKFDLKLLYPHRKRFHISEAVNFMGIMGMYFYETGEREIAEKYAAVLRKMAPDDPMTKRLRRTLFPNVFVRLLRRWMGR